MSQRDALTRTVPSRFPVGHECNYKTKEEKSQIPHRSLWKLVVYWEDHAKVNPNFDFMSYYSYDVVYKNNPHQRVFEQAHYGFEKLVIYMNKLIAEQKIKHAQIYQRESNIRRMEWAKSLPNHVYFTTEDQEVQLTRHELTTVVAPRVQFLTSEQISQ